MSDETESFPEVKIKLTYKLKFSGIEQIWAIKKKIYTAAILRHPI